MLSEAQRKQRCRNHGRTGGRAAFGSWFPLLLFRRVPFKLWRMETQYASIGVSSGPESGHPFVNHPHHLFWSVAAQKTLVKGLVILKWKSLMGVLDVMVMQLCEAQRKQRTVNHAEQGDELAPRPYEKGRKRSPWARLLSRAADVTLEGCKEIYGIFQASKHCGFRFGTQDIDCRQERWLGRPMCRV